MKQILAACLAVGVLSLPAAADYVYVDYNHEKVRLDVGKLEEMSVCMFKSQLAKSYDLKPSKFDLTKNGFKLDERKTLKGARVSNAATLEIKLVSTSFQC